MTILWSDWNDTDTGIGKISYEIFSMGKDQNGQLSERTPAVASGEWEEDDEPPTYTPQETGMYRFVVFKQSVKCCSCISLVLIV